jgi:hypothetical protein
MPKTSPTHHCIDPRLSQLKKLQRSFTVEYRSDRRKVNSRLKSIWGDLDLKSVAQEVQDEVLPFPSVTRDAGGSQMHLPKEEQGALLTMPIGQETTAPEEITMTDENVTVTDAAAPTVTGPNVAKKERKPRAKKASPKTVSTQLASASNAPAGKQKRGRKPKSVEGAINAKSTPTKHGPNAAKIAAAPSTAAVEEIMDILQLEEENQRLRKLLAEKLRAENADLRKRLNLD